MSDDHLLMGCGSLRNGKSDRRSATGDRNSIMNRAVVTDTETSIINTVYYADVINNDGDMIMACSGIISVPLGIACPSVLIGSHSGRHPISRK
jgi:hypothetical protein